MFSTIHEVPTGFRYLLGAPLNLEQINFIVDRAVVTSSGPADFAAALGNSKHAFSNEHAVVSGVWI